MINGMKASLSGILQAFIPTKGDVLLPHAFYRPITHLSWWLEGALWGHWFPGYRLFNVGLYLGNGFLCYKIALHFGREQSTPCLPWSLLATLIFLFHPSHVEVLAWTAARGDLLALLFMSSAFLSYLKNKHLTAMLCYGLALLCKETALVFPLWIFVYDVIFAKNFAWKRQLKFWIAFGSIGLAYLWIRILAFEGLGGYNSESTSLHVQLLNSGPSFLWTRLVENPIKALIFPWPGLVGNASRYVVFRILFTCLMAGCLMVAFLKNSYLSSIKILAGVLVVTIGSYLPGSVVEATPFLQNSRMLFPSSLGISIFLGCVLSQINKISDRLAFVVKTMTLFGYVLMFGLAIQPWEYTGRTINRLPKGIRHTYGNLNQEHQILFINKELDQYEGALLYSTTPDAFTRALHKEFGRNQPQLDWNHPASAHKFSRSFWLQNKERMGKTLFFAQWDPLNFSVIDVTQEIIAISRKKVTQHHQVLLAWSGHDLSKHVVDSANMVWTTANRGDLVLSMEKPDSWIAVETPLLNAEKVRIKWSSKAKGIPLKLGLFWITNKDPHWSASRSIFTEVIGGRHRISTIDIPYELKEVIHSDLALAGIRLDPGRQPGEVIIHSVEFIR